MAAPVTATYRAWIDESDCRLDDFRAHVLRDTDPADYPLASEVRSNVLVYSAATVGGADRRALQTELIQALADGPGVVVFENAFSPAVVDRATTPSSRSSTRSGPRASAAGDHFGKPGANDRIWNAAQKLALHAPDVFADYYTNDALAVVCQAWLGPRYQVTSQVNVVNPGGTQQVPHRDYHLGFVPDEHLAQYPAHLHRTSPVLTLQGAVAHCDMPVKSGPTMLLPHSQRFAGGYIAFNRPEFVDFFAEHHVQLPLTQGRCGVLQPGAVSRCGIERLDRHPPDRQPAADLVAVRPGDGGVGPHRDGARDLSVAAGDEGRRTPATRVDQRGSRDGRGLRLPHQPRQRSAHRQPRPTQSGRHGTGGARR